MPTVEIDGVGKVELDDSFGQMSPADQERTISDIVSQYKQAPAPQAGTPAPAPAPSAPTARPSPDARAALQKLFPQIEVTDWVRDPNSKLGQENPDSWHNRSKAAVDARPIKGMTFDQYVAKIKAAGYPIIEAKDEVNHPAPWATGPHWHVVLGELPQDPDQPQADPAHTQPAPTDMGYPDTNKAPAAPKKEQMNDLGSMALGLADSASLGFGDEIGAGLGAVLGGSDGTESVWNSDKSLSDIYANNLKVNRGLTKMAQDEDPGMFLTGSLLPLAVPVGGAIRGLTATGKALKAAKAAKLLESGAVPLTRGASIAKSMIEGSGIGGAYGFGSGETMDERLHNAGHDALTGAVIGGGLDATIGTAADLIANKPARWAEREADRNPFASFDAEIAQDIHGATTDRAVSPGDPQGRAAVTAKTINNIEQGYFADFKNGINALDIPDAEKLKLKEALTRKYSLPMDEIEKLRGTPAGDAVADSIIKVQRLRQLTPELKSKSGLLGKVATAADFVPGIPGIVGRGIRAVARASGDGEAARVNAAEKLISKQDAYAKLADIVGPSGQRESQSAFWDAVRQVAERKDKEAALNEITAGEKAFDRQARPIIRDKVKLQAQESAEPLEVVEARKALLRQAGRTASSSERKLDTFDDKLNKPVAEPKEAPITAMDRKALMRKIEDPAPDMRDITNPVPTDRALSARVKARNAALAKLEGGLSNFDTALETPAPAKPATGDAVDRMVERNIPGEFRALDSLADSTGLSREDATRVLHAIAEDDPSLSREVKRVSLGHNTSQPRMGPTLRPLMRAKMEELGIKPKAADAPAPIPVDEAAQERLSSGEAPAPKVKPTQRQLELTKRLDEIDPVEVEFADGTKSRASEAGYNLSDADKAEAESIRKELADLEKPQMRRVDRPFQWDQGKNRYVDQANTSISSMMGNDRIGRDAIESLGNAPAQIRDNFKTTEEAEHYINERVIPDLEADGIAPGEIKLVRQHLLEVAQAKPYATREQLEAGTAYRGPGRSKKDAK
jgi:hypothetical protein